MKIKYRVSKSFGNYYVQKRIASNVAFVHLDENNKTIKFTNRRLAQMSAMYLNMEAAK